MRKIEPFLLFLLPVWLFTGTFFLPYAIWSYPLTINWFIDNGLVLYQDIIYHHTPLPLFILYGASYVLGNTETMLRIMSFVLGLLFCYSVYFFSRCINRNTATVTLILLLISFFPFASNFNIEEMCAAIFSVIAGMLFFQYRTTGKNRFLLLCGASIGAAFMGKQIAVGTIPAIGAVMLYDIWREHNATVIGTIIYPSLIIVTGIFLSTLPFAGYFIFHGAFDDFWYWNVVYNITVYPKAYAAYMPQTAWMEGVTNIIWILVPVITGIFLFFNRAVSKEIKTVLLFLLVSTISSLPAVLRGFHVYKFLTVYPYPLLILAISLTTIRGIKRVLIIGLTGFAAIIPLKSFYVDFFMPYFPQTDIIREYGEDEEQTIAWLSAYLPPKEKIMNMGHHYITTTSQLLPHNKYITPFPWLLLPFDTSSREIMTDPPNIVIIDNRQLEQFPVLYEWLFIKNVTETYHNVVSFGTIEIWAHPDYEIPES